ncbi:MAG: DUF4254 domain-containing protein [bacterium]
MAETLGSLIDKLTIANIRLWHLEDVRRDRNLPDEDRLAAADAISEVNKQRNDLIDEIDEFLYKAAHGQVKLKAPKVKMYKKFRLTPEDEARSEELARSSDAAARARKKPAKSSKTKKDSAKKPAKKKAKKK